VNEPFNIVLKRCACNAPNLGLSVVLHWHCKDINGDDDGDEEVQIMTSAERVNIKACWRVVCIVRSLHGLYKTKHTQRTIEHLH